MAALEIAVGRGDDAHVDLDAAPRADALDDLILQHAQQLGLQRRRQLADLVEEHRAAVGQLEPAALLRDRAGERAALVAEQLALEQRFRKGGAVDRRRTGPARARCCGGSRCATSSLPVPLSPRSSTVASVAATRLMNRYTACIGALSPTRLCSMAGSLRSRCVLAGEPLEVPHAIDAQARRSSRSRRAPAGRPR